MILGIVKRLALCGTLALAARAGDPAWPPIGPEIWNLTEARTQGTGAVIVERSIKLDDLYWQFTYRIRILSEAGKAITSVMAFPENVKALRGRTVLPGGKVLALDPEKDMVEKLTYARGRARWKAVVAIPPGVTADCVVDVSWREPKAVENRWYFGTQVIPLALPWPILKEVITIPEPFNYAWSLAGGTVLPDESGKSPHVFTYRNLPAAGDVPFSLEPLRKIPRLRLYRFPGVLSRFVDKEESVFWSQTGELYYKRFFGKMTYGRAYRTWREAMLKDLPPEPQQAAKELAMRLDSRIRNLSHPTFQEMAEVKKAGLGDWIHSADLDESVEKGRTDVWGMLGLYLQLLTDAQIPHRLLFTADRDDLAFDPRLKDVTQLTEILVAIPQADRPYLWVDPGSRFNAPGLIPLHCQGGQGILFDPATWKGAWITLPVQGAAYNARRYLCSLDVDESEVRFKLDAAFNGLPEFRERRQYMALEPSAQEKLLRETLEQRDKQVKVARAEVLHATDPRENVTWHAEGSRELEGGRRLAIPPFPCVPMPLAVPTAWPEQRTDPIHLPGLGVTGYASTFRIPAGYRLLPSAPIERKNLFGSVVWRQVQRTGKDGEEVGVALKVTVDLLEAPPEKYQDLKDLLSWVQEAMTQAVVLEKL